MKIVKCSRGTVNALIESKIFFLFGKPSTAKSGEIGKHDCKNGYKKYNLHLVAY